MLYCISADSEISGSLFYDKNVELNDEEEKYSKTYVKRPHSKIPKVGFQD